MIAADSISMELGSYLAGKTDAEHYAVERQREEDETGTIPDVEAQEVADILNDLGLSDKEAALIVKALVRQPEK